MRKGAKTCIYYNDKSLIKDKVLIGTIEAMSLDLWSESKEMESYSIVNYDDEESNLAYVYTNAIQDPYESYYKLNENGDDYLPLDEANKYARSKALVEKSLLNSHFIAGSIERNQKIPAQLDPNQEIGIELSVGYYTDIKSWYDTLKNAVGTSLETN